MKKEELKNEQKKGKLLLVGAGVALLSTSAFASSSGGEESFGELFDVFEGWLTGNLGKLLALLGFAGTFLVYMMTHKGSVLFVGIVISLIAGGMVGISQTFFGAGTEAFKQ